MTRQKTTPHPFGVALALLALTALLTAVMVRHPLVTQRLMLVVLSVALVRAAGLRAGRAWQHRRHLRARLAQTAAGEAWQEPREPGYSAPQLVLTALCIPLLVLEVQLLQWTLGTVGYGPVPEFLKGAVHDYVLGCLSLILCVWSMLWLAQVFEQPAPAPQRRPAGILHAVLPPVGFAAACLLVRHVMDPSFAPPADLGAEAGQMTQVLCALHLLLYGALLLIPRHVIATVGALVQNVRAWGEAKGHGTRE